MSALFVSVLALASCGLAMDNQDRVDRGWQAFADGEHRAAIIDAKNVLQKDPQNADARLLLGRVSAAVGDGATAEKELRTAVELGNEFATVVVDLGTALLLQQKYDAVMSEVLPELTTSDRDRLSVLRIRGDALMGLQQPEAARELYSSVLLENADDAAVQLRVVESYIGERNYAQARETLNQLLSENQSYIQAWLRSATLSRQMGNAERAGNDFEKARQLSASQGSSLFEMEALVGLADVNFTREDRDTVRPILERMQELAASDIRTLLVVAQLAAMDDDWVRAQDTLQEILRRSPDSRPAQLLLGAVHKESGNLAQAEMYLSAVVAALPKNARARQLLAETRIEMDKSSDALAAMQPLIAAGNTDTDSLSIAARASLNVGALGDAVELLERGVASDPSNTDLKLQLAFAYLRLARINDAQLILTNMTDVEEGQESIRRETLQIFAQMARDEKGAALRSARQLSNQWPENIDIRGLVGSIEISAGELIAARKTFDAALALVPGDSRVLVYLAQLDELEGDYEAAERRYRFIHEREPENSSVMLALARLSALTENFDTARDWLEKVRESDRQAVAPRVALGFVHLAYKDYAAAEEVAEEAQALDPSNARISNLLGLARIKQDGARSAVSSFERAVQLAPEDPSYRLNLAKAQSASGNKATAQSTLEDSFDQSLKHLPSGVAMALMKADAGDLAGARTIAGRLQELHPQSGSPFALEAELQLRGGDLTSAAGTYDRALSVELTKQFAVRAYQVRDQAGLADTVAPLLRFLDKRPLDDSVRLILAQAYQNSKDVSAANREYENVLRHNPDSVVAANNLAWNYFQARDPRAEEIARQAFSIQPDNSAVVDTLGWILIKKGKLQDGIDMLRRAEELGEGRAEIRYHLAVGLAASGEAAEARSILQEILATHSEFGSRQQAQELLSTL